MRRKTFPGLQFMNRDRMRLLLTPLRNDRSMPLRYIYKKKFSVFSAVSSLFLSKFEKSAKQFFFFKKAIRVSKNAEIWCWLRIRWKSCKKSCQKSYQQRVTGFFALFQRIQTQHQIFRFMIPKSNFWRKLFLLTLNPKSHETAEKIKNVFL